MTSVTPLPEYTVRKSLRAKRIGLRVLPGRGLEVVLPLKADPGCVPEVLRRHRVWIDKTLARMGSAPPEGTGAQALPGEFFIKGGRERIMLAGVGEAGAASGPGSPGEAAMPGERCAPAPVARVLVVPAALFHTFRLAAPCAPGFGPSVSSLAPACPQSGSGLVFPGGCAHASAHAWLREWVRREARAYLGARLEALAGEYGFAYSGLSIRFQRTRWGSCSARGNINLNGCLLFLPEKLVRYILLHELCHTRQLNHSGAYWKLLFSLEPDALAQDRAMRWAWKHVPTWLMA